MASEQVHDDERVLSSIDKPPASPVIPPSKRYPPFSVATLALLIPFTLFGVLARLGIQALGTYDGQSIFSLAYVQAIGCLVMGFGLQSKDKISH